MSKKRYNETERDKETKFRAIKKKNAIDKHKNLIYNIASAKRLDDDN